MDMSSVGSNTMQGRREHVLLVTFLIFMIFVGGVTAGAPYVHIVYLPFFGFVFVCMMIIFMEFNGDLFNPLFQYLVGSLLSYAIIPIILMVTESDIFNAVRNPMAIAMRTSLYSTLSVLFLYLGYKSSFGLNIEKLFPVLSGYFSRKRVMIFIYLALSVSIFVIGYLIKLKGGLLLYSMGLSNRIVLFMDYGYLSEMQKLTQFSLYIFFIWFFLKTKKTVLLSVMFFTIILFAIIINILSGSRSNVIFIFITLMFIYNYYVKRIRLRNMVIPIFFIALFAYVGGAIRNQVGQGLLEGDRLEIETSFIKAMTTQMDTFIVAMKLIENVPDNAGFYLGKTYIEAPLALVPRVLYLNKPVGATWEMNKIIDDNEFKYSTDLTVGISGSPATMFHELYLNFGVLGIMAGYFLQGILYRAYYGYICKNSQNRFALLFGVYLFGLISIGDSFNHVIKLFTTITLILFFYYFARIKRYHIPFVPA